MHKLQFMLFVGCDASEILVMEHGGLLHLKKSTFILDKVLQNCQNRGGNTSTGVSQRFFSPLPKIIYLMTFIFAFVSQNNLISKVNSIWHPSFNYSLTQSPN